LQSCYCKNYCRPNLAKLLQSSLSLVIWWNFCVDLHVEVILDDSPATELLRSAAVCDDPSSAPDSSLLSRVCVFQRFAGFIAELSLKCLLNA